MNELIRIAICDDEEKDCEILYTYCQEFSIPFDVFCFSSGRELLDAFAINFFDIIFLDIEMNEPNGLFVGEKLMKSVRKPIIFFTTKSPKYAVRGYGIAQLYLTKPVEYKTFEHAISTALSQVMPNKLMIPVGTEKKIISIPDITYVEVIRHYLYLHLNGSSSVFIFRGSLTELRNKLSIKVFVQPHKSFIVNMNYIDSVRNDYLILITGEHIPIGRTKLDDFQKSLTSFLTEH